MLMVGTGSPVSLHQSWSKLYMANFLGRFFLFGVLGSEAVLLGVVTSHAVGVEVDVFLVFLSYCSAAESGDAGSWLFDILSRWYRMFWTRWRSMLIACWGIMVRPFFLFCSGFCSPQMFIWYGWYDPWQAPTWHHVFPSEL